MRSPARLNVYLDLFGGLLVLMIQSPRRNCLLLLLDQSSSISLWTPDKESHKHKLEGVQRSFTRYCFPGPWHSRPSYDTRLQILDIPTTISRFDYLHTMFIVGCFWGKYDISWEDNIKVNTSNSRQAVNVDFRHFRSRTDAFHNSLFV